MRATIDGKEYECTPVVKEEKTGRWKPEIGEEYWYVSDTGFTFKGSYNENVVKIKTALGNVYRTEEEAIKARDKQLLLVELQDYANECNRKVKYIGCYFYYLYKSIKQEWTVNELNSPHYPMIGFFRLEDAWCAVKHFGDRLNLLLS